MTGRDFVLAIDQGTTSTRAIAFDAEGRANAFMDLSALPALPADFLGTRLTFAAWVHRSLAEIEGVPTQPVDLIAR